MAEPHGVHRSSSSPDCRPHPFSVIAPIKISILPFTRPCPNLSKQYFRNSRESGLLTESVPLLCRTGNNLSHIWRYDYGRQPYTGASCRIVLARIYVDRCRLGGGYQLPVRADRPRPFGGIGRAFLEVQTLGECRGLRRHMILVGILITVLGFVLALLSLTITSSVNGRLIIVLVGIAISLAG